MNRENKRKSFEKGYYKTHACRDTFTCKVCGRLCTPENAGSDHRNHCPNCLSSLHVDIEPGDRESDCGGIMEPVAVWVRRGGEWAIIHRCKRCGALSSNRVAADDNPMKLMSIAMRPLSAPPFPLERIEEICRQEGLSHQWYVVLWNLCLADDAEARRADRQTVTEGLPHRLELVREVDGVAVAEGRVEGYALLTDTDGKAVTITYGAENAALEDTPSQTAETSDTYVGNSSSKVVHTATCGKLPGENNRVYFETLEDALAAGYRKHANCLGN